MANDKKDRTLDRIDRNILRELQKNARLSYVELADKVGLSTSPCLERVKRLDNDGWIESYNAKLCASKLHASLLVFVEISLNYSSGDVFNEFREAVARWPEIQECHLVSGDFDYLLKIRIKDMVAYRDLLGQIVLELPGVRDSRTLVAMETVKESSELMIKESVLIECLSNLKDIPPPFHVFFIKCILNDSRVSIINRKVVLKLPPAE